MQLGVLLAESAQTGGSEQCLCLLLLSALEVYTEKKKMSAKRDRYVFGMNRYKSFFHILLLIVVNFFNVLNWNSYTLHLWICSPVERNRNAKIHLMTSEVKTRLDNVILLRSILFTVLCKVVDFLPLLLWKSVSGCGGCSGVWSGRCCCCGHVKMPNVSFDKPPRVSKAWIALRRFDRNGS